MGFRTPYPGYDVLEKWDTPSFNEPTREAIRKRLTQVPPRRFLTESEWRTAAAAAARLVPQPDRREPVPITPWLDEKLHANRGDGYRYEDMPPMREAWRLGLAGIEREAERRHGVPFASLAGELQDAVLAAIQRGEVQGEPWDRLPAKRFFSALLLKTLVSIYYSHPAAWSECGFGGPASPRGYVRLEADKRDPWEARAEDER